MKSNELNKVLNFLEDNDVDANFVLDSISSSLSANITDLREKVLEVSKKGTIRGSISEIQEKLNKKNHLLLKVNEFKFIINK